MNGTLLKRNQQRAMRVLLDSHHVKIGHLFEDAESMFSPSAGMCANVRWRAVDTGPSVCVVRLHALVLCPCSWCWRVLALSSRMRAPLQTAHSASPPPPPMPTVSPAAACCHCCLHGRLSLHCMLPLLWGVGRDGARCRLHPQALAHLT